jgi:tRNA(Arg) A34 adenosine deaminase TadA
MNGPAQWLERAIELAADNVGQLRGGPFGAVIVRDGVVLAEGTNLVTSACDPTAHAEVVAIRRACAAAGSHDLSGATLYASCEPCPMCLGAIYWARISELYFAATKADAAAAGFDDSFLYEQVRLAPEGRSLPMKRIALQDAGAPFAQWAASSGKIPY